MQQTNVDNTFHCMEVLFISRQGFIRLSEKWQFFTCTEFALELHCTYLVRNLFYHYLQKLPHARAKTLYLNINTCHVCFYLQTDLDGIKWRRLSADTTFCLEPLDDPVLQSFTKCIQNDILCVWRRVQRSTDQKAPDQLSCNKELWIFWYGDEPPNLRLLLAQELQGKDRLIVKKTLHERQVNFWQVTI